MKKKSLKEILRDIRIKESFNGSTLRTRKINSKKIYNRKKKDSN